MAILKRTFIEVNRQALKANDLESHLDVEILMFFLKIIVQDS